MICAQKIGVAAWRLVRLKAPSTPRLLAANIEIDGAANHGMNEAIHLCNPDGKRVELYRDRPKEQWPRTLDGGLAMFTRTLDLDGLIADAPENPNLPTTRKPR